MAASHRVVMILGAGPNVGTKVAQRFTSAGYKVAVVSRSGKVVPTSTAALSISADFKHPSKISTIFTEVREKLGQPSVVIYNAGASIFPSPTDPFSIDLQTFTDHLAINTTSAYAAAKEALVSFDAIAKGEEEERTTESSRSAIPKVFIYTGNGLNTMIMNPAVTLGVGKSASAHFIEIGALVYGPKGYGFYYADERTAEGKFAGGDVDGDAHAEHYYSLANQEKVSAEWQQTFVKGKGYVKF